MVERFPDRGLHEFGIGIGLHTGEGGHSGRHSARRSVKEFAAIGDTVNTASRLEGVTKELKCVLVAGRVDRHRCRSGRAHGKEQTVTVKGRTGAVKVYEVVGIDE